MNGTRRIWAVRWMESECPRHVEFDGMNRDNEAEAREFLAALVTRGCSTGVLVYADINWEEA